ncbi:hypothetical protein LCGC14_2546150, partial [marine sediment metagenome]
ANLQLGEWLAMLWFIYFRDNNDEI